MKIGAYAITGVGGFVGAALARKLLKEGCEVRGVARGSYPELEAAGVKLIRADISDPGADLARVFSGCEAVFHTAAKVDMWGAREDFFRVNVEGTRAVIAACRRAKVNRLIFTSSPSVIADGKDLVHVDERYPYPKSYMAFYPETKAIAEREVLEANTEGILQTLALRPHLIFGPGDHHFVPLILERARAGRLLRVGAGKNLTDLTFIEDCTRAHLCALEALEMNPNCRGKAFFISQGEPVNMWDWIEEVLSRSGVPPLTKSIPTRIATLIASGMELFARALPKSKPLLTRFLVSQMSTTHYFSLAAAQRELGFYPRYSMREAMDLTFGFKSSAHSKGLHAANH